jgi:hypothetical protein
MVFVMSFMIVGLLSAVVLYDSVSGRADALIPRMIASACATVAAWLVWARTGESPGLIPLVLGGMVLWGTIGFFVGFIGPLISSPAASAGPLLAFVTGPLGALFGAWTGFDRWASSSPSS